MDREELKQALNNSDYGASNWYTVYTICKKDLSDDELIDVLEKTDSNLDAIFAGGVDNNGFRYFYESKGRPSNCRQIAELLNCPVFADVPWHEYWITSLDEDGDEYEVKLYKTVENDSGGEIQWRIMDYVECNGFDIAFSYGGIFENYELAMREEISWEKFIEMEDK